MQLMQLRRGGRGLRRQKTSFHNAGVATFDDLSDSAAIEQILAVNLYGTFNVTRAFLPLLTRSKGAIVNIKSVAAFAALAIIPAYSISKATLFSLTQLQRAQLAGKGVMVHGVPSLPP